MRKRYPFSYTYPNQEKVIGELVRIADQRIMISVSSRLGTVPYLSLEFCRLYDSNPYVCGMGKDNLFAKGER